MGLQIIGAGLGRTGTHSLKLALEMLGFAPCYHMIEVLMHPAREARIAQWDAITRGESADWDSVFDGYQATVDWPACNYWRQLLDRWPDAKVILTVRRDADQWFRSTQATIMRETLGSPPFIERLFTHVVGPDRHDQGAAAEGYARHNAAVIAGVPPGQLLQFAPEDGWAALCPFLGVEVPVEPYPLTNTTAQFQAMMAGRSIDGADPSVLQRPSA
jgi:hypothetical protein